MRNKKWVPITLTVTLTIICLYFVQQLLMPKYASDILEGALIEDYYNETTDHDVIFIGDCEVYENFSPITLWEEYGITSYIRGSAQQLIWQSYYLMEETLKTETPEIMVFNILSMQYGEPQSEAYNRMTLDGMKWSSAKLKSIQASMTEEESLVDYLFPILRYHSRWNELSSEDFTYLFSKKEMFHSGYLMRADVKGVTEFPEGKQLPDYQFDDICYEYLDKMVALCEEYGVQLVFVKAPSIYPVWYDEWEEQMVAYSEEHGVPYLNFLEDIEEIGIDFTEDTYDMGLHLNVTGAEKLSDWFGSYLAEEFDLADHRDDPELAAVWTEKVDFYNEMKEDQYRELEEYGYLKSYGGRPVDETEED